MVQVWNKKTNNIHRIEITKQNKKVRFVLTNKILLKKENNGWAGQIKYF